MTSPAAVLAMIRREQRAVPRLAVVSAVSADPASVTVRFVEDGQALHPLLLAHVPLPAVGDHCLVIPADGGWVYAGVVSDPGGSVEYRKVDALIEHNWHKEYDVETSAWNWQYDYATLDPAAHGDVTQGRWPQQTGGYGGSPERASMIDQASVLVHSIASVLDDIAAVGGTVHLVELVMQRTDTSPNVQVQPVMYGHGYDHDTAPDPAAAPVWTPGYGPVRLDPFQRGQTARWVLPAEWTTALATGEIGGIGFYSDSTGDRLSTYSEALGSRNARLVVTYTAPTDPWE